VQDKVFNGKRFHDTGHTATFGKAFFETLCILVLPVPVLMVTEARLFETDPGGAHVSERVPSEEGNEIRFFCFFVSRHKHSSFQSCG
jgi:hypothetical protein